MRSYSRQSKIYSDSEEGIFYLNEGLETPQETRKGRPRKTYGPRKKVHICVRVPDGSIVNRTVVETSIFERVFLNLIHRYCDDEENVVFMHNGTIIDMNKTPRQCKLNDYALIKMVVNSSEQVENIKDYSDEAILKEDDLGPESESISEEEKNDSPLYTKAQEGPIVQNEERNMDYYPDLSPKEPSKEKEIEKNPEEESDNYTEDFASPDIIIFPKNQRIPKILIIDKIEDDHGTGHAGSYSREENEILEIESTPENQRSWCQVY